MDRRYVITVPAHRQAINAMWDRYNRVLIHVYEATNPDEIARGGQRLLQLREWLEDAVVGSIAGAGLPPLPPGTDYA